jgi:predicted metal-dependent hydrolase
VAAAVDREALLKALQEFNCWRFYDCHETLEDVWRETGPKGDEASLANFYQGLIKVAAGLHHLLRNNYKGTVNLLRDARRLLAPYRPFTLGVDVDRLLEEVGACLARVEELGPERIRQFEREKVPSVHYDEGAIAGGGA